MNVFLEETPSNSNIRHQFKSNITKNIYISIETFCGKVLSLKNNFVIMNILKEK